MEVDREGSCSKRTSPSRNRPVQVGAVERQQPAAHYRRTHDLQGLLDLDQEIPEGDPNHKTKRLLRPVASRDRRIAFEVARNLVGADLVGDKVTPVVVDTPAEGRKFQTGRRRSAVVPAVEEDRTAEGEGGLAVVSTVVFGAVKMAHSGVETKVSFAAEGTANSAVAEDKASSAVVSAMVPGIQAEDSHTQVHSGVVEIA